LRSSSNNHAKKHECSAHFSGRGLAVGSSQAFSTANRVALDFHFPFIDFHLPLITHSMSAFESRRPAGLPWSPDGWKYFGEVCDILVRRCGVISLAVEQEVCVFLCCVRV
jgi:hypothetical protein